ncbi:hypothetical protein EKG36_11945 [Halomonas nitroreducens]|uniref:Uncharacterized protein n=2 Tax=Halomonas nitroreducens TaxID=447425 RepID=A0A431V4I5_9GAMM|nr:hypothetical protein EKG36_11945 [Halomonas nitroreducens]
MMNIVGDEQGKGLVAKADKDTVRSMFHLMVGKPDSNHQMFTRPVCIRPEDIYELNERVQEKLRAHHQESLVASAALVFDDKTTTEFGGWAEFESYNWSRSKVTKEVRLKWQFLLNVQGYELPQQHTLTVKLCASAKPLEVLQAMFSKNPEESDEAEVKFAPVFCRVDFINSVVSEELMAVVDKWNAALPVPESRSGFHDLLDRHKRKIAMLVDYSTPVIFPFASVAYLKSMFDDKDYSASLTIGTSIEVMTWLVFSLMAFTVVVKISHLLARRAFSSIKEHGAYSVFQLTSGDRNRLDVIRRSNKKVFSKFVFSALVSLVFNVSAGIFVALNFS